VHQSYTIIQFAHFLEHQENNDLFSIDVEYKVDDFGTGDRKVYFKQARPYSDSQ